MGVVTDIVLPLALAVIMVALGLGLTREDFLRVFRQPRDFLVGALCQVLLLPAVAVALVSLWPMPPELALGVVIIAAAPGGVTSNILTAFARGDVALSISLTAVMSLLSVLTIPLIVVAAHDWLIGGGTGDVSVTRTALSVFAIVTVPALIGLAIRHAAPGLAIRIEPAARTIATVLFVIVLAGAVYQERDNVVAYIGQAGLVTLTLNLAMLALAFGLATAFASGPRQRAAIALECGLQNGTLAIAVATLLFDGGLVIVPAATYSLLMFATALLLVAVLRRTTPA